MTDDVPPRVRATLPGGGRVEARLLRWRQDQDGHWWAEVMVNAPADAVRPRPGEDYTGLPRERDDAPPSGG